jgi:glycosyltransferase involved in cell wall biosynthesis
MPRTALPKRREIRYLEETVSLDRPKILAGEPEPAAVDLSVVLPCLNEAETLATCIEKAREGLRASGKSGEIVVADNGSTDGSQGIAQSLGARVVPVAERGYGAALMGGIAAARGRWIVMGDADDSYDFREIPRFVERLEEGADLVQGCRLPSGGGRVMPGAMPVLHRWWGNPMFSRMARLWFGAPIHDIHCGLRAFRRDLVTGLDLRCTGMEFASEMVIKATLAGARIAEAPITLHPDGRRSHAPHLRTFRDGWRHLRFFLLYSPRWLFLVPGALLALLGLVGYAVALPGLRLRGVEFDVHTLLFASLALILGYQSVLFAILTKAFAERERILPPDPRVARLLRVANLERGLLLGAVATAAGAVLLFLAVADWFGARLGPLDYRSTMRLVIPGVTLAALGVQTVLSSFFLSLLGIPRR